MLLVAESGGFTSTQVDEGRHLRLPRISDTPSRGASLTGHTAFK
jgi:hypothetical protein